MSDPDSLEKRVEKPDFSAPQDASGEDVEKRIHENFLKIKKKKESTLPAQPEIFFEKPDEAQADALMNANRSLFEAFVRVELAILHNKQESSGPNRQMIVPDESGELTVCPAEGRARCVCEVKDRAFAEWLIQNYGKEVKILCGETGGG